jgi:hypothetical protein
MMRVIALACFLVLAAFLPSGFVSAQSNANTDCGETTLEIDACVQSKLAATDHLLNEVYDIVIREKPDNQSSDVLATQQSSGGWSRVRQGHISNLHGGHVAP